MLDDDELMYTRILNHNATPDEITVYIDKLHKEMIILNEQIKLKDKEMIILNDIIKENTWNVIPKQKIIDKIIELRKEFMKYNEELNFKMIENTANRIVVLQELLEENKK